MCSSTSPTRFLPSLRHGLALCLVILCLTTLGNANTIHRSRTQGSSYVKDDMASTIKRASPSDCKAPMPSEGPNWSCVGGNWFHNGNISVSGDWVEPRLDDNSDPTNVTYTVNGTITIGGSLIFEGAVAGILTTTGCVEIVDGVIFDWSEKGIPDDYDDYDGSWTWVVAKQDSENTTLCPYSLTDVPVSVRQGGCKNADLDTFYYFSPPASHDSLRVTFSVGTDICLRNGLLLGLLVCLPAAIGIIILVAYVAHRCSRKEDDDSILDRPDYSERAV